MAYQPIPQTDREQANYFRIVLQECKEDKNVELGRLAHKAWYWFDDAAECAAVGLTKYARQSRRNGERWAKRFHEFRRSRKGKP